MSTQLSYKYFQPKHGAWRGSYRFSLVERKALMSSSMHWLGKLSALSMSMAGELKIETEVDTSQLGQQGSVRHTTKISKWGIPLYRSVEYFLFGADHQKIRVKGYQRMMPFWWIARDYGDSYGQVHDDGESAEYVFLWFGIELQQRSLPKPDGLLFTQELPGCRASFLLNKYA